MFQKILDRIKELFAKVGINQPMSDADLSALLDEETKGSGLDWRTSIVDFLKLINVDSSRKNRDELALELGVTVGDSGSPERNEALRVAVFKKLAETHGNVPQSF